MKKINYKLISSNFVRFKLLFRFTLICILTILVLSYSNLTNNTYAAGPVVVSSSWPMGHANQAQNNLSTIDGIFNSDSISVDLSTSTDYPPDTVIPSGIGSLVGFYGSDPVIDQNDVMYITNVYAGNTGTKVRLIALDTRSNLGYLWSKDIVNTGINTPYDETVVLNPIIGNNNTIYAGAGSKVVAIDLLGTTHDIKWTYSLSGGRFVIGSSLNTDSNRNLYFGGSVPGFNTADYLMSIDQNGAFRWEKINMRGQVAIDMLDNIIATSSDATNKIYSFNVSGAQNWQKNMKYNGNYLVPNGFSTPGIFGPVLSPDNAMIAVSGSLIYNNSSATQDNLSGPPNLPLSWSKDNKKIYSTRDGGTSDAIKPMYIDTYEVQSNSLIKSCYFQRHRDEDPDEARLALFTQNEYVYLTSYSYSMYIIKLNDCNSDNTDKALVITGVNMPTYNSLANGFRFMPVINSLGNIFFISRGLDEGADPVSFYITKLGSAAPPPSTQGKRIHVQVTWEEYNQRKIYDLYTILQDLNN